jgi:hypothetical protein
MPLRVAEPSLPFVDPTFDQEASLEQTRAAFYTVQATVTSDATRGTGAPVCAGCGELGTVGDDGVCAACGRHVTGGEFDWVLVAEARPGA